MHFDLDLESSKLTRKINEVYHVYSETIQLTSISSTRAFPLKPWELQFRYAKAFLYRPRPI